VSPAPTRLYLLVEEASREFDSRLLIASVALDRGFEVVIAPQWAVWENLGKLRPGIVVFKGTNRAQSLCMRRAKAAGFLVAVIDEEPFGVSDCVEILKMWDAGTADACHLLLAQGTFQANCIISKHPGASDWIRVTGNPRSDLLGVSLSGAIHEEAERIRKTQGDFILFNTNFGAVNPRHGDAVSFLEISERVGAVNARNKADMDYHLARLRWEKRNLAAVLEVIGGLVAKDFPWRIVVRPHPAENIEHWREGLGDVPGVAVIREGDHRAWGLAARLLVHSSSTTGLEAFLLGASPLSLCVDDSPWNGFFTSNLVNRVLTDSEMAIDVIRAAADGGADHSEGRRIYEENLVDHLLTDRSQLAANRIVDALVELRERYPEPPENAYIHDRIGSVRVAEAKVDPMLFEPARAMRSIQTMRAILNSKMPLKVDLLGPWMLRFRQEQVGNRS
jgi:surface carbohydrate biosynthesis protein